MLDAMLRFLLKPRWIALTVFAVVVAGVCFRLAFWQLDRLDGRRYYNDLFRAGMTQAPQPVESLLAVPPEGPLSFRQVSATGRYDAAEETILYGRPLDGRPGNHVLTPLVLDDGTGAIDGQPIVILCSEGYTSSLAAAVLQDMGLHRATDLIGGFEAWEAGGLAVTAGPGR